MRTENKNMQNFLKENGVKASVKFLWTGSMSGTWRFYDNKQKWTTNLIAKLTWLGFVDFDGKPLSKYSGNGGQFSVFVKGHNEFLKGVKPSKR